MASRRLKRADTELTFATIDSEKGSKEKVTIVRATTKDIALEHVESTFEAFGVSESQLEEVKALAATFTLEGTRERVVNCLKLHKNDPNFPHIIIQKFEEFVENDDIMANPQQHRTWIEEIKLEMALVTYNSPYAEVRAVVDNFDDPTTPSSTIRVWVIGLTFSVFMAFINQLFSIRQPAIHVGPTVAQLLAYPLGRAAAAWLPDWGLTVFGTRHSLNPGPFSKKEHMLITIMSSIGGSAPYTTLIIWVQYMPQFFGQAYAGSFAYQILVGLATNFLGYGFAGACRRFLVWPSYCVWPTSLVTIALINAFHEQKSHPVIGPFKRLITMSRFKFFLVVFSGMFIYFWIPNTLFQAMSIFNWISWIDPNNTKLNSVVGFNNGVGLNPIPTFDWNNILHGGSDPLMLPAFTTLNKFAGNFFSLFMVLGLWYSNAFHTGYLPLNSNRIFDNRGKLYNISRAIDGEGLFNQTKYDTYSPAFLSAGNIVIYMFSFSIYTAMLVFSVLYHWHEIKLGFIEFWTGLRSSELKEEDKYEDVHNRLMSSYKEAPNWWFLVVLLASIACGILGVMLWPTYTTPGVIFFGIGLTVVFIVPIGVIKAMTGVEVNLAILAEFIGGSIFPGNALAMNYMKAYGFVTASHAIWFSNDLKLAHYVKIPPRQTFAVQMVATAVSTLVCTVVLNFQMNNIPGVCTMEAPNRFTCPMITSFFTASVLWGTIGPRKVFGEGGMYSMLLLGFPIGIGISLAFWYIKKKFPGQSWMRQVHPVVMLSGATHWAPYNVGYIWPAVPIALLSWSYVRKRWMGLWSKFNFLLSASLSAAIAISGLVIFFAIQWPGIELNWWGNTVSYQGCEGRLDPCRLNTLGKGEYFGPRLGEFH